jgi:hypothetical protein
MNTDRREMLTADMRKTEKALPWDLSQSFFIWSFFLQPAAHDKHFSSLQNNTAYTIREFTVYQWQVSSLVLEL